ncbi:MAG: hypothetical protein ACI9O2_000391 [Flammeovirgaceae bacterium]|jgi:hypothetical protein
MKDYMLIFIGADYGTMGLSPEEIQERMGRWMGWTEKMAKAGVMKSGEALHADGIKRISGNAQTVTDVAAAELKELIGGFFIVKADNADEAIKIAADFPDYDLGGTVEVREVMVFDR